MKRNKVPYCNTSINSHLQGHWPVPGQNPGILEYKLVFLIDPDELKRYNFENNKGMWVVATPFEFRAATIRAAARDFKNGFNDASHVAKWRALFLRTSGQFRVCAKDRFDVVSIGLQNEICHQWNSGTMSPLQLCMTIQSARDRLKTKANVQVTSQ